MLIKSDEDPGSYFISTDEDPCLRIESFAIIKLRGVTTKLKYNVTRLLPIQNRFALIFCRGFEPVWDNLVVVILLRRRLMTVTVLISELLEQLVASLLAQPTCYKLITTCSKLVNNWEQQCKHTHI